MSSASFIGFIGDADFHDGSIEAIEEQGAIVRVRIRGASGRIHLVEFDRTQAVRANQPEGMMLYAVSEFAHEPPLRTFVFANWEENSAAYLEVDAENVRFQLG
jgi:hypothetical protein